MKSRNAARIAERGHCATSRTGGVLRVHRRPHFQHAEKQRLSETCPMQCVKLPQWPYAHAKGWTLKHRCTTGKERRITRWEHEHVLETVQRRLDENPQAMHQRCETVEHPFGTPMPIAREAHDQ
jgi:hypothetical protein